MNARRIAWSIVGLLSLPAAARAGPVTFQIIGEVTRVSDPQNLLDGGVEVGSALWGIYTFESTTADSDPDPARGIYANAILSLSGTVGSVGFSGPIVGRDNDITIHNASHDDLYSVYSGISLGGVVLNLHVFLGDTEGTALASDRLSTLPPNSELYQDFKGFTIADSLEQSPIVIEGLVTSIVPEPTAIALLLVGMFLLARHPRVKRELPVSRRIAPLVVAAILNCLVSVTTTRAADCNGNGIDDRTEFNSQCKVDLVFVIDTSTSMDPPGLTTLCSQIDVAITELTSTGVVVNVEKLRISPDPDPPPPNFLSCPASCCTGSVSTGSVSQDYGTTTPGMAEVLADCSNPEGKLEDWGVATAIVAGNKTWTSEAIRIIVPMSDAPPRCGSVGGETPADCDDLKATYHAITLVSAKDVIVIPIMAAANDPFGAKFVEGGARVGKVLTLGEPNLGAKLAKLISSNCGRDCNNNGLLDACEIDGAFATTTPDCNAYSSDCCVVHSTLDCSDTTVSNCVCGFESLCCQPPGESWNENCVGLATFSCGASCAAVPDRVPDECQASPDCNANSVPDICDISCGGDLGPCAVSGCGQKADCNHNCIPDDCEAPQCNTEQPDFCDCNGNGVLNVCDIANATSCDADGNAVPDECSACCVDFVCQNRPQSQCSGQYYPGQICSETCCGSVPCCCPPELLPTSPCIGAGTCALMGECECRARSGHVGHGDTPYCTQNTCDTGSCCTSSGCVDSRQNNGNAMTKTLCESTLYNGTYVGGVLCKGGRCEGGAFAGMSCSSSSDCDQPAGTCMGSDAELAQPSPCAPFGSTLPTVLTPLPMPNGVPKNRYLSIVPRNPDGQAASVETALRVQLTSLNHPDPIGDNYVAQPPREFYGFEPGLCCSESDGCIRWVGKPGTFMEAEGPPASGPPFRAARLQCAPFYHTWGAEGAIEPVHVFGAEITPSSVYQIQTFAASCTGQESTCTNVSCPARFTTARWADVWPPYNPRVTKTVSQPSALDLVVIVNKFKNVAGAPFKRIAQLQPNLVEPNADVGALDIVAAVDAVKLLPYPYSGPCPCPSLATCGGFACPSEPTVCTAAKICVDGANHGADCTIADTCTGGVCTPSDQLGLGPGSTCVKTCSGGDNDGEPCINNSHCPGGESCGNGYCRDRCGRCSP